MRKAFMVAAVTAMVLGLAPTGPVAQASNCNSNLRLFFYYGAQVSGVATVSNPATYNHAAIGCTAGSASGTTVDMFYVPPGAGLVTGRDNIAICTNINGSIVGLGVNDHRVWEFPKSALDGSCDATVGNGGAGTPRLPLDPTALGTITASTANGSITFKTIDR